NADPFGSGRLWRYWGTGYGLRSVARSDADALFRGRACYASQPCILSDTFRLTVAGAGSVPSFSSVSQSQLVREGQAASFVVAATGLPVPTLQWQRAASGASAFDNIAGATAPTYTTAPTTLAQNGTRYRVVASNGFGSATSAEIVLSVSAVDVA